MSEDDVSAAGDTGRSETPAERSDRNWSELLQELRVTQTGIQILSGFLLTLPFQARFTDLDPVLVGLFLAAAGFATAATLFIVAPVPVHRALFGRHVKHQLVDVGAALAKAGLVCLAITIALVTALLFGFVLGTTAGVVAAVVSALGFLAAWLGLPLLLVRRAGSGGEVTGDAALLSPRRAGWPLRRSSARADGTAPARGPGGDRRPRARGRGRRPAPGPSPPGGARPVGCAAR